MTRNEENPINLSLHPTRAGFAVRAGEFNVDIANKIAMEVKTFQSIEEFIGQVRKDRAGWPHAWFRGEPKVDTPLVPRLYRQGMTGKPHDENKLLQFFRMKAPIFSPDLFPDRRETDQWLFLAQHVGLPTRLLDWSEGALVGLYFALLEPEPIVWMLNPIELNQLSVTNDYESTESEFPLTWYDPKDGTINIGSINIRGAWERDSVGVSLPVAVQPTNIHPRMSVQRSCFTVQGKDKSSLAHLVPQFLRRYEIDPPARQLMRDDLQVLGISHSTVFPDLNGLANELAEFF